MKEGPTLSCLGSRTCPSNSGGKNPGGAALLAPDRTRDRAPGRHSDTKRIRRNVALMQPNQGQTVRVFFALVDCDKSQVP
jgi:hypothetical protein